MSSQSKLIELQRTLYTSTNPTRRWLHCTRRDWIIAALKRNALWKKHARALEVGPGSGLYLPVLADLFDEVLAIDIEGSYLEAAKSLIEDHPNLSLKVDNILASELPQASFDLILCSEVLEHVVDSKKALSEMHRLLRPGGKLILSTPQRYSSLEVAAKIAFLPGVIDFVRSVYREPILETGHINLMTEGEIIRQLMAAGFQIEERYKSGLYLPLLAEFAGEAGLRFERWLESKLQGGVFDGVLWTQYYVASA